MATDSIVPVVGDERLIRDIIRKKEDSGVRVLDTEAIWLTGNTVPAALEEVFYVSARLGATNLLVVGNDPDEARQLENYIRLCDMAAPYGLTAAPEFILYCVTGTLEAAQRLVLGAARPNAKFLIDVLHLMRSDGGPSIQEWEQAIDFLTRTGKTCTDVRQEFIFLSDVFGVSMLVETINGQETAEATQRFREREMAKDRPRDPDCHKDLTKHR